MLEAQRNYLIQEAQMQAKALQKIGVRRRATLSITVFGILLAYSGFVIEASVLRGASGIVITICGGSAALFISIGYKNGKKNVEHILEVAQK